VSCCSWGFFFFRKLEIQINNDDDDNDNYCLDTHRLAHAVDHHDDDGREQKSATKRDERRTKTMDGFGVWIVLSVLYYRVVLWSFVCDLLGIVECVLFFLMSVVCCDDFGSY
jgi:hypothetical protein